MSSSLKTCFLILTLVSFGSLSLAQNLALEKATPSDVHHKHTKYRGKPLFKYPNEHPVYIVTYTQQDLEKIRQDRFMRDLKNATFSRRTASHVLPVASD
jgi:hypothetical protein